VNPGEQVLPRRGSQTDLLGGERASFRDPEDAGKQIYDQGFRVFIFGTTIDPGARPKGLIRGKVVRRVGFPGRAQGLGSQNGSAGRGWGSWHFFDFRTSSVYSGSTLFTGFCLKGRGKKESSSGGRAAADLRTSFEHSSIGAEAAATMRGPEGRGRILELPGVNVPCWDGDPRRES